MTTRVTEAESVEISSVLTRLNNINRDPISDWLASLIIHGDRFINFSFLLEEAATFGLKIDLSSDIFEMAPRREQNSPFEGKLLLLSSLVNYRITVLTTALEVTTFLANQQQSQSG